MKFTSGTGLNQKLVAQLYFDCQTMANRMAYSIVMLTVCLICCSGAAAVPVSETTTTPIQQDKREKTLLLLDKFEMAVGTETDILMSVSSSSSTSILPKTAEPPVATTKFHPSLVLNPLLSGLAVDATSPATTEETQTVIGSVMDVTATLNDTELNLETTTAESTTVSLTLPSPTQSTTTEGTSTVHPTYADVESSAESFDSGESSSSYSSVSKLAPTQSSSLTEDKNLLPMSTTPLPIPPLWPWMLFILNGNATVANRRQRDLGTYLRLNLAARLDADYNVSFH